MCFYIHVVVQSKCFTKIYFLGIRLPLSAWREDSNQTVTEAYVKSSFGTGGCVADGPDQLNCFCDSEIKLQHRAWATLCSLFVLKGVAESC